MYKNKFITLAIQISVGYLKIPKSISNHALSVGPIIQQQQKGIGFLIKTK